MEGYLWVKTGSILSSWTRVWVILDKQQLAYYDHLDLEKQIAIGIKGNVVIKDAKVHVVSHHHSFLSLLPSLSLTIVFSLSLCLSIVYLSLSQVQKYSNMSVQHGLQVTTDKAKIFFNAREPVIASSWYIALVRAVKIPEEEQKKIVQPLEYREILKIDPSLTQLTKSIITRSYRKICLKEHPDKVTKSFQLCCVMLCPCLLFHVMRALEYPIHP